MTDLQKQISMCARHHAKWKRAADFTASKAQKKKYLERAVFWLEMQADLVSIWNLEKNSTSSESRKRAVQAKSSMSMKLANYGRNFTDDL